MAIYNKLFNKIKNGIVTRKELDSLEITREQRNKLFDNERGLGVGNVSSIFGLIKVDLCSQPAFITDKGNLPIEYLDEYGEGLTQFRYDVVGFPCSNPNGTYISQILIDINENNVTYTSGQMFNTMSYIGDGDSYVLCFRNYINKMKEYGYIPEEGDINLAKDIIKELFGIG